MSATGIRTRLLSIQASIQPYASWHIEELERSFRAYTEILREARALSAAPDFHYLVQNVDLIGKYISDSKARQRPEPYNLAVNMLQLDIESLLAFTEA